MSHFASKNPPPRFRLPLATGRGRPWGDPHDGAVERRDARYATPAHLGRAAATTGTGTQGRPSAARAQARRTVVHTASSDPRSGRPTPGQASASPPGLAAPEDDGPRQASWRGCGRGLLAYKCALHGGMLVSVDPRNSSRECARCGFTSAGNRLDQANLRCAACKLATNADINAARVILQRGLTALSGATPGCGGTAREASTCRTVNRLSIASSTGWHEGIRNPRLEGRGGHQHTTVTSSTSTTRARPPCPRPGCTTPPSRERPRARPRRR